MFGAVPSLPAKAKTTLPAFSAITPSILKKLAISNTHKD